jgi:hypothetical protein
MAASVSIPVPIGELYDKISILELKLELIPDKNKIKNVEIELRLLNEVAATLPPLGDSSGELRERLKQVNKAIWDGEEYIRSLAANKTYGEEYISASRAIHHNNDRRAEIKRRINILSGSTLIEEKSFVLPES